MSVILLLAGEEPVRVDRMGESYVKPGVEDVVFALMRFHSGLIAHMHLSWLDPHKERRFTVVGSKRMATFDDMEIERKLTVYDKGFDEDYSSYGEYIARSGDIFSPRVSNEEPLRHRVQALPRLHPRTAPSRAPARESALRVVRVLEAASAVAHGDLVLPPSAELRPSDRARGCCSARAWSCRTTWSWAANVVVHAGTRVGAGARLQDGCVVGKPLALGRARARPVDDPPGPTAIGAGTTVGAGAVVVAGRARWASAAWWATRPTCASGPRSGTECGGGPRRVRGQRRARSARGCASRRAPT